MACAFGMGYLLNHKYYIMPTYVFFNPDTGVEWEDFMSISKKEKFLESHPHIEQRITAPNIVGGHGDRVKIDGGFKDVLNKIGDAHPGSNVHERHGSKDIKREKSVQTIKKHMDKQQKK